MRTRRRNLVAALLLFVVLAVLWGLFSGLWLSWLDPAVILLAGMIIGGVLFTPACMWVFGELEDRRNRTESNAALDRIQSRDRIIGLDWDR